MEMLPAIIGAIDVVVPYFVVLQDPYQRTIDTFFVSSRVRAYVNVCTCVCGTESDSAKLNYG